MTSATLRKVFVAGALALGIAACTPLDNQGAGPYAPPPSATTPPSPATEAKMAEVLAEYAYNGLLSIYAAGKPYLTDPALAAKAHAIKDNADALIKTARAAESAANGAASIQTVVVALQNLGTTLQDTITTAKGH